MFRRDKFWLRELERREREWAAERAKLIDQILLLAGKPSVSEPEFTPPPLPDEDFTFPDEVGLLQ